MLPMASNAQSSTISPYSSSASPSLNTSISAFQTLPTPPSNEHELSKSFSLPQRDDLTAINDGSNNTSSLLASRRQNVSLPAFTFPSQSQRSYNFGINHPAPSLLTPPSASDSASPVEGGHNANTGYWTSSASSQPPSSSYHYTSSAPSQHSYSSGPSVSTNSTYTHRGIISPISTSSRSQSLSPHNQENVSVTPVTTAFDSNPYSSSVSVTTPSSQSYGNSFPFAHNSISNVSHSGLGSPHDPYSPPSSLPPPTPSHGYYTHASPSYAYPSHPLSLGQSSPSVSRQPATNSINQLHYSVNNNPSLSHGGYSTTQQRYLPNGVASSMYSQHGASIMTGSLGGHNLGANSLQHTHIHPPQQVAHAPVPHQERPFRCDQCPQSFNRNHDLKRHKRIHLAVKPFPCPNCEKSFSRKDALKRHVLVKGCGNASNNSKTTASSS